jgi:hypothetical protein
MTNQTKRPDPFDVSLERWYFIFYDKLQKLEISVSVNWDRYEQLWGSIKESSGQQKW